MTKKRPSGITTAKVATKPSPCFIAPETKLETAKAAANAERTTNTSPRILILDIIFPLFLWCPYGNILAGKQRDLIHSR